MPRRSRTTAPKHAAATKPAVAQPADDAPEHPTTDAGIHDVPTEDYPGQHVSAPGDAPAPAAAPTATAAEKPRRQRRPRPDAPRPRRERRPRAATLRTPSAPSLASRHDPVPSLAARQAVSRLAVLQAARDLCGAGPADFDAALEYLRVAVEAMNSGRF